MKIFLKSHLLSRLPIVCVIQFLHRVIFFIICCFGFSPNDWCRVPKGATQTTGHRGDLGGSTDVAVNNIISHCEKCIPLILSQ